jgi:hypothetical protein
LAYHGRGKYQDPWIFLVKECFDILEGKVTFCVLGESFLPVVRGEEITLAWWLSFKDLLKLFVFNTVKMLAFPKTLGVNLVFDSSIWLMTIWILE